MCSDLVAFYHFDNVQSAGEDPTLAIDWSGNDNHVACTEPTCPVWVQDGGRFGGAYSFTPNQRLVSAASSTLAPAGGVTVSVWLYPEAFPSGDWSVAVTAAETGANFWLGSKADQHFFFTFLDEVGWHNHGTVDTYSAGAWYHVVAVTSPQEGRVRLYVNGALAADEAESVALPTQSVPLWVGWSPVGNERGHRGLIDEVAIWSKPLDEQEIQTLYPAAITGRL